MRNAHRLQQKSRFCSSPHKVFWKLILQMSRTSFLGFPRTTERSSGVTRCRSCDTQTQHKHKDAVVCRMAAGTGSFHTRISDFDVLENLVCTSKPLYRHTWTSIFNSDRVNYRKFCSRSAYNSFALFRESRAASPAAHGSFAKSLTAVKSNPEEPLTGNLFMHTHIN